MMRKTGAILGGEPSGHIIFHRHATTGDGLLTSLKLLEIMARTGRSLADLVAEVRLLPQVLQSIRIEGRQKDILQDDAFQAYIDRWTRALGGGGRLLVRASGTEPVIRILVQGPDMRLLQEISEDIERHISRFPA
jgi:phosphoglucosamine mutase